MNILDQTDTKLSEMKKIGEVKLENLDLNIIKEALRDNFKKSEEANIRIDYIDYNLIILIKI